MKLNCREKKVKKNHSVAITLKEKAFTITKKIFFENENENENENEHQWYDIKIENGLFHQDAAYWFPRVKYGTL